MHEILNGKMPYSWCKDKYSLRDTKLEGKRPCAMPADCPPEADQLLKCCYLQDPEQRPRMEKVQRYLKEVKSFCGWLMQLPTHGSISKHQHAASIMFSDILLCTICWESTCGVLWQHLRQPQLRTSILLVDFNVNLCFAAGSRPHPTFDTYATTDGKGNIVALSDLEYLPCTLPFTNCTTVCMTAYSFASLLSNGLDD